MSASLSIEIVDGPLERVAADLLVVRCFADQRPLSGATGRTDWRLCGLLSDLIRTGRLAGERGEAVLIATGRGFESARLMVLGLGTSRSFDLEAIEGSVRESALRALDLGVRRVAFAPLDTPEVPTSLAQRLEAVVNGAGAAAVARDAALAIALVPTARERDDLRDLVPMLKPGPRAAGVALSLPARPPPRAAPGSPPGTGSVRDGAGRLPPAVK